jgi:hypothetical protein
MTPRSFDSIHDARLAEALRQLYPDPDAERTAELSRRILQRARPLLSARRHQVLAWWEYPAAWAGMLLPFGLITAAAAASLFCIVARSAEPAPATAGGERVALLQAATSGARTPALLDLVLAPSENELVSARDSER